MLKQATRSLLGLVVLASGILERETSATNPSSSQPAASDSIVIAALRAELDGDNRDRRQLLHQALQADPNDEIAHWLSGHVQPIHSRWVEYQKLAAEADPQLAEYRDLRATTATDADELLKLAIWCGTQGLHDEKRAHLRQLLEFEPDNADARKRLGDVDVQGVWISQQDLQRAAARQEAIADSLREWGPVIDRMERLAGNTYQREIGRAEFFAVTDPSAIPAMVRRLASGNEAGGLLLIEWISRFNIYQASQAMARTALLSPHNEVRYAAIEALRSRPYDEYVPLLLQAMRTPVAMHSTVEVNSDGWLVLDMIFEAEAQNEHRQLRHSTEMSSTPVVRVVDGSIEKADREDWNTAKRFFLHRARQGERARLRWNSQIRQANNRAQMVLRNVTESLEQRSVHDWWDWWIAHNELYVAGVKPSLRVQPDPDRIYIKKPSKDLTRRKPGRVRRMPNGAIVGQSCLVAGTPIWTETGLLPIERIQIGDRVLAQDVETGEIAFKPVMKTTVRPPARTVKVTTERTQFRATGGHPFWVNGEGWRFVRDLEPGMHLHGTAGAEEVVTVEPADEAEAYNLVVADFHTYFLGEGLVLSHDNSTRAPTNALVPGLLREP